MEMLTWNDDEYMFISVNMAYQTTFITVHNMCSTCKIDMSITCTCVVHVGICIHTCMCLYMCR